MAGLKPLLKDIADAIREKDGSASAIVANDFPERIRAIPTASKLGTPLDPVEVYKNTRPADWLPMPEPQDNEMYLLFHIPDGVSSFLAFTVTCTGNYTVALGTVTGGQFVQKSAVSVASGSKYEAELFAKDYDNLTNDGMKQVMIKISGTNIFTWEPSGHNKRNLDSVYSWNIIEITCRLPSGTMIKIGNDKNLFALQKIRYFSWFGENLMDCASKMFNNCYSLVAIPQLNTASVTDMSYMFANCYSLVAIPQLNTANVTNMSYMFANCYSLVAIPQLNTASVTNMSYMFNNCKSIVKVQKMNCEKTSNFISMFGNCESLVEIEEICIGNMSNISLSNTFANCASLAKVRFKAPTEVSWSESLALNRCCLSRIALVELFDSLPTIRYNRDLGISLNPGISELSDDEKAIATNKRWTLKI